QRAGPGRRRGDRRLGRRLGRRRRRAGRGGPVSRVPVGVLLSGSGTNLQALIDAAADPAYPARIAVVISNRRDARGLERAREAGIPALWLPHRAHARREDYDAALVDALRDHGVEWVALAGFLRLLTPVLARKR